MPALSNLLFSVRPACLDVIAKLPGYDNIAKGTGETKGRRIFRRVSRFLSKIVGAKLKENFFFQTCEAQIFVIQLLITR